MKILCGTFAGEARTNLWMTFFSGFKQMDMPVLADQQELIYISSVQIEDVIWRSRQERCIIEKDG